MSTINQASAKFKELTKDLKNVRNGLVAESDATQTEIETTKDRMAQKAIELLSDLSPEAIAKFDDASIRSNAGRSFDRILAGFHQQNATVEESIKPLKEQWHSPATEIASKEAAEKKKIEINEMFQSDQKGILEIDNALAGIKRYNETHYKKIDGSNFGSYYNAKLSRWDNFKAFFFQDDFHDAVKVVANYEPVHGDFYTDLEVKTTLEAKAEECRKDYQEQQEQIQSFTHTIQTMNDLQKRMKKLDEKLTTTEEMQETIAATVVDVALKNPEFVDALVEVFGLEAAGPIALAVIQVEGLQKSDKALQAQIDGIDGNIQELEKPLPSFNTEIRNGHGSRQIPNLDLDVIEQRVACQTVAARQSTIRSGSFRTSVSTYQPDYTVVVVDDSFKDKLNSRMWQNLAQQNNDALYYASMLNVQQAQMDAADLPPDAFVIPDHIQDIASDVDMSGFDMSGVHNADATDEVLSSGLEASNAGFAMGENGFGDTGNTGGGNAFSFEIPSVSDMDISPTGGGNNWSSGNGGGNDWSRSNNDNDNDNNNNDNNNDNNSTWSGGGNDNDGGGSNDNGGGGGGFDSSGGDSGGGDFHHRKYLTPEQKFLRRCEPGRRLEL